MKNQSINKNNRLRATLVNNNVKNAIVNYLKIFC